MTRETDGRLWIQSMVALATMYGPEMTKTEISTVACVAALMRARTPAMYSAQVVKDGLQRERGMRAA